MYQNNKFGERSNAYEGELDPARIKILYSILLILLGLLLLQLGRKQVLEYGHYKAMAQDQQVAKVTSEPERGLIYAYDRTASDFGVTDVSANKQFHPLAINTPKFDILTIPRNVVDPEKTALALCDKLKDIDCNKLTSDLKTGKLYLPPIAKKVEKDQAEAIKNLNLKGVMVVPNSARQYPEGEMASQILGFVNFDGQGSYGIERYYNNELKGVPGVIYGVKDTHGRVIDVNDQAKAQNGVSLVLTIDSTVQFIIERELKSAIEKYGAQGGTIIVAEPKTGRIIGMASSPAYDPNKFNEVSKDDQWKFVNPSVTYTWEPGSIFKPVVMAAAIDQGLVEPDTKGDQCFGSSVVIDGYTIHNAEDLAHGCETMTQILENSDNVAMTWVASKMDKQAMGKYLTDFGFGQKTSIDVEAESKGSFLDPKQWRDVHRATIAFGQGISVTPIQMVEAYSAIANGGKLVKPHLLDRVISTTGEEKEVQTTDVRQVIKKETADKVKQMLVSVVEKGHGKAAKVDGFSVAGKTGTAQIAKSTGGYEENANIGGFIGFAPAEDPKFVMLVKLDRPTAVKFAESSAAPTFGTIAKWLLTNYYR